MNTRKYSVAPKNPSPHADLPMTEVFFPTISEDHCVLNHVGIVAYKSNDRLNQINSKIRHSSYTNVSNATIDSFLSCGRFCESTNERLGIEISMGSSDFFDKSYALALVIADHLARKTTEASKRYIIAATGELLNEAGQVSKVEGIQEKVDTLLAIGKDVGVNVFIFPKANEHDVPISQLENAGIQCLAISKVSEALNALNIPINEAPTTEKAPFRLSVSKRAVPIALAAFLGLGGGIYLLSGSEYRQNPVDSSEFMRTELVNALNDFIRYPHQWGRVEEVVRLSSSLSLSDLERLNTEQRSLVRKITQLSNESDKFLQKVKTALLKAEGDESIEHLQSVHLLFSNISPLDRDRLRLYDANTLTILSSVSEKYLFQSLSAVLDLPHSAQQWERVSTHWTALSDEQRTRFSQRFPDKALKARKTLSERDKSNTRIHQFASWGNTLERDDDQSVDRFLDSYTALTAADKSRLTNEQSKLVKLANELSVAELSKADELNDSAGLLMDLYLLPHNSTKPPVAPEGNAIGSYVRSSGNQFSFADIYNDKNIATTLKDRDRGMHYYGFYQFPTSGQYLFSFNFQSGEHKGKQWTRECRIVVSIGGAPIFDKIQSFGEGQSFSKQVSLNINKGKEPFDLWFACENLNNMLLLGPKWDVDAYKNTFLEILVRSPLDNKLTALPLSAFSH
ncbi:hypothetical protein Q8W40_18565 [Vibrio penaeicida]|uniref:hypothetical protein n=1 Tax=Vibrio penaeicida TaxID=104609 RepID=UPI00273468DA|nr:hypothetical protein [Vibrio penaeicida]MDP2574200.1 hypothetical protein [Vibrio penaeicida]